MKIYDISQEVFSGKVYPGDPAPRGIPIVRISDGNQYNLSAFYMCAHNGTHIDAPFHFLETGKTVEEMLPECFIGMAYVVCHDGCVSSEDAMTILRKARSHGHDCDKRILIKGRAEVSAEAAEVFAKEKILLLGNESQTVGPESAPMAVHKILLSREIVLLEGIRLRDVPEGVYLLNAAPLKLSGFDGAPCRAVLIMMQET